MSCTWRQSWKANFHRWPILRWRTTKFSSLSSQLMRDGFHCLLSISRLPQSNSSEISLPRQEESLSLLSAGQSPSSSSHSSESSPPLQQLAHKKDSGQKNKDEGRIVLAEIGAMPKESAPESSRSLAESSGNRSSGILFKSINTNEWAGVNQLGRTYSPGLPLSMSERQQIVELHQSGWKICDISKLGNPFSFTLKPYSIQIPLRHAQLRFQNIAKARQSTSKGITTGFFQISGHWLSATKGCQRRATRISTSGCYSGLPIASWHCPAIGNQRTTDSGWPLSERECTFTVFHQPVGF